MASKPIYRLYIHPLACLSPGIMKVVKASGLEVTIYDTSTDEGRKMGKQDNIFMQPSLIEERDGKITHEWVCPNITEELLNKLKQGGER